MAEYIEREAVLEILRKQTVGTWRGVPCYPDEISRTFREVSKIPAADVAPVVRGRWVVLDECSNEGAYCSVCNKKVYKVCYGNCKMRSKFCPNCGAKMEG